MRTYKKDYNINRRRRQKKSKRPSARKHILCFYTVCCCLAVLIAVIAQLGKSDRDNTVQPPLGVSDIGTGISETGIDRDENGNDETNGDETSWCLILVNKWNAIPDDYKVERIKLKNGESVDIRIYPALQEMFDNARRDNIYPVVASGYRTAEKQQSLLDEKINDYENEGYSAEEAKTKAEAWVAVPGTSEHQLGIAVDINADGIHSTGREVYEWLEENAYKYGFICRYPSDKTEITGVINEPWHYRYVGVTVAAEIHSQGICLEEYLDKIN